MPDMESSAATDWVAALPGALPAATGFAVAFSGGRDSTVLLHALAGRVQPLRALHVEHGLHPQASDWADHCRAVAQSLGLPCEVLRLDEAPPSGNQEAWARERRYAALGAALGEEECLLTAHHAQDQAETLLLNLLRGSGPRGLAAMPARRRLPGGQYLARPLLAIFPEQLADYAARHGLAWVEDPANQDRRFDRNFLRHEILPRLRERQPGAVAALARSAGFAAELVAGDDLAEDLAALADGAQIDVAGLRALPECRRNRVFFAWLRAQGLPLPRRRMLAEIWRQMLDARRDSQPVVAWPGAELSRQRDKIQARSRPP